MKMYLTSLLYNINITQPHLTYKMVLLFYLGHRVTEILPSIST